MNAYGINLSVTPGDETLVVWSGEFSRTVYSQGTLTSPDYGRDHQPRDFCTWMTGGRYKP
jgi:hypothetical protein